VAKKTARRTSPAKPLKPVKTDIVTTTQTPTLQRGPIFPSHNPKTDRELPRVANPSKFGRDI